ncbi:hypothetical protein [Microbacterium sediminis]|uniref:Uncharacterized protein n=1 Tax=Microbacterium sediminis TaxID=904291 RepID=A0A1B9NA49_9MICO|nr:hypothetical protein [Microbacterium sediminis]OCG73488.1 hypothetical protein A7J15_07300 [Microbacterium sediminis]QBR73156.1 hypothetical protein E3O41_01015 [Microbacterium sediminis]
MYLRLLRASVLLNAWAQFGVFLLFGSIWATNVLGDIAALPPLMLVAILVMVSALAIGLPLFFRENRRLQGELATVSAAYAASGAEGAFAPARVVRSRPAAKVPGFLAGYPTAVEPTARVVVLNALTEAGARRILALAPASWRESLGNRAFAAVRLASADVALIDGRIDAGTLQQIGADSRWNGRMPGEHVGMQLAWMGGAMLLGFAIGFGLTWLLGTVFA